MLADLIATAGVEEIYRPGSHVGVMAIHGGLEAGTDRIAGTVTATTGAALYAVVQPSDLRWHVPSIRFDPAHSRSLAAFLGGVRTAVSIHGYGRPGLEGTALLGGNNRALAHLIHAELAARGVAAIADIGAIPRRLRGVHPRNPVNRPPEFGVQVELAMELRAGEPMRLVVDALSASIRRETARIGGSQPAG